MNEMSPDEEGRRGEGHFRLMEQNEQRLREHVLKRSVGRSKSPGMY